MRIARSPWIHIDRQAIDERDRKSLLPRSLISPCCNMPGGIQVQCLRLPRLIQLYRTSLQSQLSGTAAIMEGLDAHTADNACGTFHLREDGL